VNELKSYEGEATGTISAFSVDSGDGKLTFLNMRRTHGTDPCHVMLDSTGRFAIVANFMSGSVSVFPVKSDGTLEEASDFIQHRGSSVHPTRQTGPHAHSTVMDGSGRYFFVPDLGLDQVVAYSLDARTGKLKRHDELALRSKPGAGPRHIAFHSGNRFAYVINELDSTITSCTYDEERGLLREIHTLSTLPSGYAGLSSCADINVSPSGRFVYGSNRGHDSIVIYRVDAENGRLEYVGHQATMGRVPRSFTIDPTGSFLLVANQSSDSIATFRIDQETGRLDQTGLVTQVPTPVCVKVVPFH